MSQLTPTLPDGSSTTRRGESLAAWIGDDEGAFIPRSHEYVALDDRSRAQWRYAEWGAAWALTSLRLGLNPSALDGERLSRGRHLDPDSIEWFGVQDCGGLYLSTCPRKMLFGQDLRKVHAAIVGSELSTMSSYPEERRRHARMPLMRRVAIKDFCNWAELGLEPAQPWPVREEEGEEQAGGIEQMLELPARNTFQHLVNRVEAQFHYRYVQGGLLTPTVDELVEFLTQETHEPPNRKRASAIARVLRPANTPKGPRRGRAGRTA